MTDPPHYPSPPPYGAPPPYGSPYPYPPPAPTNGMAVASLICAFIFAPLGIVFGHISLSQIKRTGEEGRGLAVSGLVISYLVTALTIVALVAGVVLFSWMARVLEEDSLRNGGAGIPRNARPASDELPAFNPPAGLGANCTYPATVTPAAKVAKPPRPGKVPTTPPTVNATMVTNDGSIGVQLDNAKAPCTVNSFVSLAQQGYFDDTPCHRLTASAALAVLQCGDPTGTGRGGPGYRFANEYPTNQFRPFDPTLQQRVRYPRGTLAMANAGPDSNGSQFFIIYRDSMLPPTYSVFGTVDDTGMATVDEIVGAGITGDPEDGKPGKPVTVKSIRLD